MTALNTLNGNCHCGAIRFVVKAAPEELTTCNCSICKRKNALMFKVHESHFTLLQGQEFLTEYQFHTHTATHYFCSTCGIYPFHKKRVTPDYIGINVGCIDQFDFSGIPIRETNGINMS